MSTFNENQSAGRIRVFGASNWTLERVDAANEYAELHGVSGFAVISNQFSLARMVNPVWPGSISSSDPESRNWFKKTGIPLMPWLSQARGFFVQPVIRSESFRDEDMTKCWHVEDNFRWLRRATELGVIEGVAPMTIALVYVLGQPFSTFPLIGPHQISKLADSIAAFRIELTSSERSWLNLEMEERE